MDFNCLTTAHLEGIKERVSRTCEKVGRNGFPSNPSSLSAGRLLNVAVLVLDIPGFWRRPALDAKAQDRLLRASNVFFSEVVRIVQDYGGAVEKNAAAGLVAYFEIGYGASATQRAVACALTLSHANTEAISPAIFKLQVEPFAFRVVIDYGTMTFARPDTPQGFTPIAAIGATTTAAQQMLTWAKAGEILLGNKALFDLPPNWRANCIQVESETDWVWSGTTDPYHFYRYTSRWRVQD